MCVQQQQQHQQAAAAQGQDELAVALSDLVMGSSLLLRPSTLTLCTLLLLLVSTCLERAEAKNKAGKLVKNAAKAYTAHRAARSIWRIAFIIFGVIVSCLAVGGCFYLLRRRLMSSSSEGFGLLREGP